MDAPSTSSPTTTPIELTQRWVDVLSCAGGPGALDHHEGEDARTLWVSLFDGDDRQLPTLVPIADVPHDPSSAFAQALVAFCLGALAEEAPGGWASMALERPGPARATGTDLAWARSLVRAASAAGLDLRPLHLAGPGWVLSTGPGADDVHRYPAQRESA